MMRLIIYEITKNLKPTKMFEVVRYTGLKKQEWDTFVDEAKNGVFLFKRDYMDYHADRFVDCSLMIYKGGRLMALLPANISSGVLYSHQGLTFGGILHSVKSTAVDILDAFKAVDLYVAELGVKQVLYKAVPYIYDKYPSQEDLYALYRQKNFKQTACNISTTIKLGEKLGFSTLRKRGVKKAKANGVSVFETDNFKAFWGILQDNLTQKYDATAVHSYDEICLLKDRFPDNIKLYVAKYMGEIVGGVVMYISSEVAHSQYISANAKGKELGCLDLIFDVLINEKYSGYKYFDFGTSTEHMGQYLNENLIFQKEGFGGRAVCYNSYSYDV